jgi:hypothetical protein
VVIGATPRAQTGRSYCSISARSVHGPSMITPTQPVALIAQATPPPTAACLWSPSRSITRTSFGRRNCTM